MQTITVRLLRNLLNKGPKLMRTLAPIGVGFAFIVALLFAIVGGIWPVMMNQSKFFPEQTAVTMFHKEELKNPQLSSDGPFGKFDNQQLQRGFQVYTTVCANCHSMRLVAYSDLAALGYNPAEIKAIAKKTNQPSVSLKTGEANTRPSLPSDHIPGPYANEYAARAANGGALPPDFSLIAKAREGGAAYIYSLVTGYQDVPAEQRAKFPESVPDNKHYYNPYFANLNIAMPPPLASDNLVTYADGTKATKDHMARDVAAFLVWAAEPKLGDRHAAGVPTVIFLLIFSLLCYLSYRAIWANKEH